MKILLIHSGYLVPNGADYVGLFSKNALECMGHDVIELGGFHRGVNVTADIDRAEDVAREERPDFILHMHGLPHPRMGGELLDALNATGIPTVLWVHNEEVDFDRTIEIGRRYSLFCNYTTLTVERHRKAGANVLYLPLGGDHTIYHPVDLSEADRRKYGHDLAIIGAPHPIRVRMIDAIKDDYDIFINWDLKLPNEEVNKIYNASRIMLAPVQDCDQTGSIWNPDCSYAEMRAWGCPCRTFDVPTAGGFQIQVPRVNLGDVYDLEAEVALADGWDKGFDNGIRELRRAIDHYLEHEDERRRIAEAGCRRSVGSNLYRHRMQAVIDRLRADGLLQEPAPRARVRGHGADPGRQKIVNRIVARLEPANAVVVGRDLLDLVEPLRSEGVEARGLCHAGADEALPEHVLRIDDEGAVPEHCDLAVVAVDSHALSRDEAEGLVTALRASVGKVLVVSGAAGGDPSGENEAAELFTGQGFERDTRFAEPIFGSDDILYRNPDYPEYTFLLPIRPAPGETDRIVRWANALAATGCRVHVVDTCMEGERPEDLASPIGYRRNDLRDAPSCGRVARADYVICTSWDTATRAAGLPDEAGACFYWIMREDALETEEPDLVDDSLRLSPIPIVTSDRVHEAVRDKCVVEPLRMDEPRDRDSVAAADRALAAAAERRRSARRRILYVTAGYVWVDCYLDQHLIEAFRSRGHEVDVFELMPDPDHAEKCGVRLDVLTEDWKKRFRDREGEAADRLLEKAGTGKYDLVFFFHGMMMPEETLARLRDMGVPTVVWMTEEPYELKPSVQRSRLFDYVFLQDRSTEEHQRRLSNPRTWYLPHGFAPSIHRPVEPPPERYRSEVCIVGTAFPRRVRLVRALAKAGVDVLVVGRKWKGLEKHGVRVVERVVTLEEANLFVNGAKINLTVHRGALDMASGKRVVQPLSPNATAFFIAGAGGFQMCDDTRPDVLRCFRDGREIVVFDSADDLVRKVRHYLEHDEERRRIGCAARERALREHTYAHRLDEMLRLIGEPVSHPLEFDVSACTRTSIRPRTTIIVPVHNAREYLENCLLSIRECTTVPYDLMIVNNASTDGTAEWLDAEKVPHIDMPQNLGYGAAINCGIRLAHGTYLAILNSDVLVSRGWLRRLMGYLRDPLVGLVGPCTNYAAGFQQVKADYGEDLEQYARFVRERYGRHRGEGADVQRLVGFAFVARRTMFESIGLFDERFGIGNYEDDDICLRARIGGWKIVWARDVYIHHFGSRSFAEAEIDYQALMRRNAALFRKKWGFVVDHLDDYGPPAAQDVRAKPAAVEEDPSGLVAQGHRHLNEGRVCEALGAFKRAVARAPESAEALNELGYACGVAGQWNAALAAFAKAVKIDARNVTAWRNMADAAFAAGRFPLCIKACETLVRMNPQDAEVLLVLANAYMKLGAFDSAALGYKTVLKLDPESREACDNLALALRMRAEGVPAATDLQPARV